MGILHRLLGGNMTVSEVIEHLKHAPQDGQFMVPDDNGDWYTPTMIFQDASDPFDTRTYVV
jgi:hypothetical protein